MYTLTAIVSTIAWYKCQLVILLIKFTASAFSKSIKIKLLIYFTIKFALSLNFIGNMIINK
jgi:hypothetical protein